jgi:hypothetical protein
MVLIILTEIFYIWKLYGDKFAKGFCLFLSASLLLLNSLYSARLFERQGKKSVPWINEY